MRVLTIVGDLDKGGTARVAQTFALSYAKLGHVSAVMGVGSGGPRETILNERGIETFITHGDPERVSDVVDSFRPDAIHIHRAGMESSFDLEILRRVKNAQRCVLETNIFGRVDYGEGPNYIDLHLQLSAWCLWKWQNCLGRRQAGSIGVVIPNPVDVSAFTRATPDAITSFRRQIGIPDNAFVCGRIGQASPGKWHAVNILAFNELATKDAEARLVLLGMPDSLQGTIQSLPSAVQRRIIFLPTTVSDAELSLIYSSFDCFLHAATIGESFGLVLAEAMLCGCPVVTVSRPDRDNSQLEVVGHEQGGLVAASLAWLPNALLRMREDSNLRQRLARQARERIVERYEADRVAARVMRLAEIALSNEMNRGRLRAAIEAEGSFQTHTSDEQIQSLLRNTIGRASPMELVRKRIIHHAWFQKVLNTAKNWTR